VTLWWYKGDSLNQQRSLNCELKAELQQQEAENEKLRADMTQVTESIQVMLICRAVIFQL